MSDALDDLESALDTLNRVAASIGNDDLDRPTPCDELDVRALLQHLIGWQLVGAAIAADQPAPFAEGSPTYVASADPVADLRAASTQLIDALRSRAEPQMEVPYRGLTSLDTYATEYVAELVLHTWDLASALARHHRWSSRGNEVIPESKPGADERGPDQPVSYDAAVLERAHEGLSLMLQQSFAPYGFKNAADKAPTLDLDGLLIRSGRNPAWSAPSP